MSIDTSTRQFLRSVGGGPDGAIHSVLSGGGDGLSHYACGDGVLRLSMSSSVVWFLVLASIYISIRSYIVPPHLIAVLMDAWVSWLASLCLLMNWFLWILHSLAMWGQEFGKPYSGHASVGACLYMYANFPLYSWAYMNLSSVRKTKRKSLTKRASEGHRGHSV